MKFLIIASFVFWPIFAQEDCVTCNHEEPQLQVDLKNIKNVVQSSSCNEQIMQEDAKKAFLEAQKTSSPQVTTTIAGVKVSGRKDEIEMLKRAMGKRQRIGFKEAAMKCSSVHCLTTALFGNEEVADRAFAIYKDTGYVIMGDQHVKDEYTWQPDDIRILHQAFNFLPQEFDHLSHLDEINIIPKGYSLKGDPSTLAWAQPSIALGAFGMNLPGKITFTYRSMKERGPHEALHTIIHELTHHIDNDTLDREADGDKFTVKNGYLPINGWVKDVKKKDEEGKDYLDWRSTAKDACFASEYAATSPFEDFAEAVADFMLNPDLFSKKCPKIYSFVKTKVFKGKEFKTPWPTINISQIAKTCLKTKMEMIVFGKNSVVSTSSIKNPYFEVKRLPDVKLDESCAKEHIQKRLQSISSQELMPICLLQGEKAMVGAKIDEIKNSVNEELDKLYSGLKSIDWSSIVEQCPLPITIDSTCIQDKVRERLKITSGIINDSLFKQIEIEPKLNHELINKYYGNQLILNCVKILAKSPARGDNGEITMPALFKSRGSVYCGDMLMKKLVSDKLASEKISMSNYSLQREYFASQNTMERITLMEAEFHTAMSQISCSFFGKSKCIKKKMLEAFKNDPKNFSTISPEINGNEFEELVEIFQEHH